MQFLSPPHISFLVLSPTLSLFNFSPTSFSANVLWQFVVNNLLHTFCCGCCYYVLCRVYVVIAFPPKKTSTLLLLHLSFVPVFFVDVRCVHDDETLSCSNCCYSTKVWGSVWGEGFCVIYYERTWRLGAIVASLAGVVAVVVFVAFRVTVSISLGHFIRRMFGLRPLLRRPALSVSFSISWFVVWYLFDRSLNLQASTCGCCSRGFMIWFHCNNFFFLQIHKNNIVTDPKWYWKKKQINEISVNKKNYECNIKSVLISFDQSMAMSPQ